ncbi:MAG: leucyl aminopeptidase [Chloroflexi bacterium]|nr:leucyl aminopeptidase [Chloroflexota bacterium]
MQIIVATGPIEKQESPLLVVNLFEGQEKPGGATGAVDAALHGQISALMASGDFKGKKGEIVILYPAGAIPAHRVLLVGLGKAEKCHAETLRQVAAAVAQKAAALGVAEYHSVVHGAGRGGMDPADAAQAVAEGTILGLYRYDEYKTKDKEDREVEQLTLVELDEVRSTQVALGAQLGQTVARATCLARDLINKPAAVVTPMMLAATAQKMAEERGLSFSALDEGKMRELGMGALLAVNHGSAEPPRLIILEHNADRSDLPTIVLVGKGLTFDSGGLNIKPGDSMTTMRGDMAGGAAVFGTMQAVAELRLPLHVVGLVPATENMPGSRAYKPGDILTTISGKTIEVLNTDAEGRLILADALAYAKRWNPTAVVDLATLTGACAVALGRYAAGLMTEDDDLAAKLSQAGDISGDRVWRLPMWEEYQSLVESDVADVRNTGKVREGGAIAGAMLLREFAEGYRWAHLDIAGTSFAQDGAIPYRPKGGTGFGVRLLVQFLQDWK